MFSLLLLCCVPLHYSFSPARARTGLRNELTLEVSTSVNNDALGTFTETLILPAEAKSIALLCDKIGVFKQEKETNEDGAFKSSMMVRLSACVVHLCVYLCVCMCVFCCARMYLLYIRHH